MRFRAAIVIAVTCALAAAAGLGVTIWSMFESTADPDDRAHLWVSLDGGACTRSPEPIEFDPDVACDTFGAAYDAANESPDASIVLVRGGTYADPAPCVGPESAEWSAPEYPCVSLRGDRESAARITIAAAPGETVKTGAITLGASAGSGVLPDEGPDHLTLRGIETLTFAEAGLPFENGDTRFTVTVVNGSRFVRLENLTAGAFVAYSTHDLEVVGGSYGPCRAQSARDVLGEDGTRGPLGNGPQPCNGARADHATEGCKPNCIPTNILIEGVELHDFDYPDECLAQGEPGYRFPPGAGNPGGCHWRSLYLNCVRNVTLRNSTVRDSVFSPWTTHSGCTNGTEGLLVENNQFGRPVWQTGDYASGPGGGWENAYCATGTQPTYRDVTIRFNSFAPGATGGFPGSAEGEDICETARFVVYGNVFGVRSACGTTDSSATAAEAPVTWRYNVYAGDVEGVCDATDVNIGRTAMPFYADDDPGPAPGAFALTGSHFAGDDLVPADDPELPCPEADAAGNPRPRGAGRFCDAGAFERAE